MAKAEISWNRRDEAGGKVQVYAHHVGNAWKFYHRARRFDQWQETKHPPLEDWLELLDAVERRIARRLQRPEESARVRQAIRERFPEHEF